MPFDALACADIVRWVFGMSTTKCWAKETCSQSLISMHAHMIERREGSLVSTLARPCRMCVRVRVRVHVFRLSSFMGYCFVLCL